ncbi:MAG: peptidylprolyl isomerase, partial [Verrucomicrobiaceae bacterium]
KQRQIKGLTPPTPAEVDAFYNKNSEKFRDKDYIKMSTITIPKYPSGDSAATPESQKKIIEELRTKITGGAEFAQMARTYSQDSRASNGGSWSGESGSADFIERSTLDKSIAEVAFALKPGGISKVLEAGPSYMLILCEAKRPGTSTPLDKVRPDIEKFIKSERGRGALNSWLASLARKSTIQPDSVRDTFMRHVSNKN